MTQEILAAIKDADMVLVGLGEEFDNIGIHRKAADYVKSNDLLQENKLSWLLPAFDKSLREQNTETNNVLEGLQKLSEILVDKNYFVVSTAMNQVITQIPWKDGRLVTPCGGMIQKQCEDGCQEGLQPLSEADEKLIADFCSELQTKVPEEGLQELQLSNKIDLGVCPKCGKKLVLNNIYAEHYDENGYLPQWQLYTKWLQGTLNKNLVILELGVGMNFPSVIRWPFEKVAFFNNKAHLYRINEKLYQLSEDLKGKGTAIPKNSIDWLSSL